MAWWHKLLIVLAAVALSVNLATRICHLSAAHRVGVQSSVTEGMRQHMDSDASHWVAPVPCFVFLQTVSFYPKVAPAGPPLPTVLFDESLYNRPPPPLVPLA